MKILIVDDHAVVRRGLKEILEEEFEAAEFGEAGNAADALRELRAAQWDVVVLDIALPGRSGMEVLKGAADRRPKSPILVLSMYPEEQYAIRALKAGAAGYLTKETAPEELVAAVRKILDGGTYVSASLAEKLAVSLGQDGEKPAHELLSNREYEVMCMIAAGESVSQIAARMSLSVKTVSTYRARVLRKMGMRTNAELMRYALKAGLVE